MCTENVGIQQAMSQFYGCSAFPVLACACLHVGLIGDFLGLVPRFGSRLGMCSDMALEREPFRAPTERQ